ncbi:MULTISPECIES: COX15/CtaA family protein [unclassified Luteococcus]|uniref:COX15/CtaA family protein n=1 Tax=unclassified Luteococcus TaxID=2639923 RepID=UPI00313BF718
MSSTATSPATLAARGDAAASATSPSVRLIMRLAAIFGIATVITGSINSATGSGFACPTWPGCYPGHFGPEAEVHDIIEFGHRIIAASTGFVLLGAAVTSIWLRRARPMVRILPWAAVVGAILSAVFGRMVVLNGGISKAQATLDLFGALTVLMATTLVTLSVNRGTPRWHWTPLSRWATGCMAGVVVLHLLGVVVAGKGSFTAVVGWPMWRIVSQDVAVGLQVFRLVFAAGLAVALFLLARKGWHQPTLRPVLATLVGLFALEFVLGQVMAQKGVDMWWAAGHCAAAGLILVCVTLVAGRSAFDRL